MTAVGDRKDETEEITLDDGEWPVAEQYRVPDPVEPPVEPREDGSTIVVAQQPAPGTERLRPNPFRDERLAIFLLGLLAAIVVAALAGWYLTRDDAPGAAQQPVQQPTGTSPTTPEPTPPAAPTTAPTRPVPDLTGATLGEARQVLDEAGLRSRVRRSQSERPPGEVLGQLPRAGSDIAEGGIVTLTVSGGPGAVSVPDVVGGDTAAAQRELAAAGLEVEIVRVASSRPAGTVIRQVPAAGTEVEDGSVVRLHVAKPREPVTQTVDVPRLTGLHVADARARLRDLGLRSSVTRVESNEPEGTVVEQEPAAGSGLERGGSVALTVSAGPATVPVPDVVGLDEQSARAQLESAGFQVRTVDEPTEDPAEDGIVVGQTPSQGTERRPGSVVTLRVSRLA